MRILITGGAGFVGSNLAVRLRREFPDSVVVCMDNLYRRGSELNLSRLHENGVRFHSGDVREPSSFPPGPFDFVIECSAEPSVLAGQDQRVDYLFHTNLVGAFNCLEKARFWNSGFLFLSTSRVYPVDRLERHPWREEATRYVWTDNGGAGITSRGVAESIDMSGARSMYGYTKYAAELLIEEYRSQWELKAVVNRCGVIAGPWQFGKVDQGVVSLWVLSHYLQHPLKYLGYGGQGKQVRDLLHIDDVCDLIVEQLRDFAHWDGFVGNVGGGSEVSTSLMELTTLCQEVVGRGTSISAETTNRRDDCRIFISDCRRIFERTQWRPRRGVREIVSDIHSWIRANESTLRPIFRG
jgi:CDP-paratose 2-epimerase